MAQLVQQALAKAANLTIIENPNQGEQEETQAYIEPGELSPENQYTDTSHEKGNKRTGARRMLIG